MHEVLDGGEAGAESDPYGDRSNGVVRFNGLVGAATQLSFAVQRVLEGVARERDLSLPQLRLVFGLLRVTPAMSDLAKHLRLGRPSASGLVTRAEKRGLVRRERRGGLTYVTLTNLGRDVAEDMLRAIKRELTVAAADLSDDERQLFTQLAERLAHAARDPRLER